MSSQDVTFTKGNLDSYLKELGKAFRKINGTATPAEIILIGGAAILASYHFREMTTDVDAVIHAASSMKEAINRVADKLGLPGGWLNSDFTRTGSYSPKLTEVSVYYKTFSNILQVRTVAAEYLIAMKLRSGRRYKNDLSDIIGILHEHQKKGEVISMEMISQAVYKLYGGWKDIPENAKIFIENAVHAGDYEKLYAQNVADEQKAREVLIRFNKDYPKVLGEANADDILASLKKRNASPSHEKGIS